jgi:ABC-type transport system involved in multi-copper enzyme maturation permease subunit
MRAYLAVVQDSFREALASRVLWVLLILITLLLAVLAPLGYRQQATRELTDGDVSGWPHFLEHVAEQSRRPGPAQHIVSQLDASVGRRVSEFQVPGDGEPGRALEMLRLIGEFRNGLNQRMLQRDFYDADAWGDIRLVGEEARELAAQPPDRLTDEDVGRLNRLRLEAAFPEYLAPSLPTSVKFCYLGYDFGQPLPLRKADFKRVLDSIVQWVTRWLVGTLGVLVAILVTASIVPQTFDPGSLNLLLSKPVWRSLLFLSKFLGGCAFILLNASYLVFGLWLILGARFGLWDPRILLSIPVYVFMFAVYYTVSALAGLLWRNAIVSVVMTILFWAACFVVGVSKSGVEQLVLDKMRVTQLLEAGDTLVGANEAGLVHRWDDASSDWVEIFQSNDEEAMQRRMAVAFMATVPPELRPVGPVYDRRGDQLIQAVRSLRTGQMTTLSARREDNWRAESGASASMGTRVLLAEPDGSILAVSSLGLYRLTGDLRRSVRPLELFGFSIPLPAPDPFQAVGPDSGVLLSRAVQAAINQDTGELAIYSRSRITLLRQDGDGRYEVRLEKRLAEEDLGDVAMGYGGDTLLIGREDGRIIAYEAQTLEPRQEATLEGKNQPRFIEAAPGGDTFSIVFHHGRLWIYDRPADRLVKPPGVGQRDVSCCVFPDPGSAYVVDRLRRVTTYKLPDWRVAERRTPPMPMIERIHRYALVPLYTVFPKPRELDTTIQYVLTGKETVDSGGGPGDLQTAQKQLHPWRPVWSSLAFMVVMLALGCVYLHRQDY